MIEVVPFTHLLQLLPQVDEKDVTFDEHLENIERVLKECERVHTPEGKIFINVGDIYTWGTRKEGKPEGYRNDGKPEIELIGSRIQNIMRKFGLRLTDRTTWRKGLTWANNPQTSYHEKTKHTSYRIVNNTELILIFEKDGDRGIPEQLAREAKIPKDEYYKYADGVWDIQIIFV